MVKTGVIVDASIVDFPFKPKGITTFEIEEDRAETERSDEQKQKEEETHKELKKQQKTADPEGRWIKKSGKTRYWYKKHKVSDQEGLVIGVLSLEKMHTQNLMESMVYNLYRAPGIIMSNSLKMAK